MPGPLFRSAFTRPDVTPAEVLQFHRDVFGLARMSNDDPPAGGGDGGDKGGASGSTGSGSTGSGSDSGSGSGSDKGFPADTPLAEMTEAQQLAYWKHQARKHESTAKARGDYDTIKTELDKRRQADETASEKAVREAREQGAAEARTAAANATVEAMLRMGLRARGITDQSELDEIVESVNVSKYANDKGVVDDEKVLRTINRLAGQAGSSSGPDTGQGRRDRAAGTTKAEAGRAEAQKRFGAKQSATA